MQPGEEDTGAAPRGKGVWHASYELPSATVRGLREGFAPGGPRHRRARAGPPIGKISWRGGDSAPLATVVSLPTAREARPGAQRRDTPRSRVVSGPSDALNEFSRRVSADGAAGG